MYLEGASPSFAHRKHMHSPAKSHGRPGQCGTGWCATGMATAEGGTVLVMQLAEATFLPVIL